MAYRGAVATTSPYLLVTAGYDHKIRFWEAPSGNCYSGNCYRVLSFPDASQINRLEITPDKKFLAAAGNPNIKLYETQNQNPNPIRSFEGHTAAVLGLGFQHESKWMFTASEDKTLKIWDMKAAGCQREYENVAPINDAVLHPNQGEIFTGDVNGNIRIWDLAAGMCSTELVPDGQNAIQSLSIAAEDASMVVAGNKNGHVFIYKISTATDAPSSGSGPAPDSQSQYVAVKKLEAHSGYCTKVLLSPDCTKLATCGSDKVIKIWDTQKDFALLRTLKGHQRWVWDLSFTVDSKFLLSASTDKLAKLWNVETGEERVEFKGHSKGIVTCCLNDYEALL